MNTNCALHLRTNAIQKDETMRDTGRNVRAGRMRRTPTNREFQGTANCANYHAGAGWGGGYIPESANKQPVATDIPPRPALEQIIYFQYFPETISDSRELNVEEMRPFFLSNSIPTISGSSPRNLGFTIRFSRERWLYGQELSEFDWDKYNVDVALAIQVIRSMAYPNAQIGNIGIIPQPVKLTLPGTGIGINSDTVVGLITSYSAEYLAFFPDGQPRLANVALQFSERQVTPQRGDVCSNKT